MPFQSPTVEVEPPLKRRKIRKGTTSCWECKKRKVRCHFISPTSKVCVGCSRRFTPCLSQEYDVVGGDFNGQDGNELGQEAGASMTQSQRLGQKGPASSPKPRRDLLEDVLTLSPTIIPRNASETNIQLLDCAVSRRYRRISRDLHAVLPSQRDADLIIAAGNTPCFLQFFTRPYKDLFRGNMRPPSSLSALPSPCSHPVLLARTLLYLAHGIQNLHPSTFNAEQLSLASHSKAMRGYLHIASTLVIGDVEMLSSLEGLECLILEGVYYINAGDLRRAWSVFRRAIALAQLLGLPKRHTSLVVLDPQSMASPSFMWYRIVHQDRYLSLMLSLPPGVDEATIAVPDRLELVDCPSEYLERIHCVLTGRMAARNNSINEEDLAEYSTTSTIDKELQKAAEHMAPEWWLLPTTKRQANGAVTGNDKLEDVLRILVHITHFQLLILLHLPYMLLSSPERPYNYSEAACVNASRECLNRYIRFRCMDKVPFCCRAIDFAAFIACLALLLAHLDESCRSPKTACVLAHHRLSDRAMVEEVLELMKGLDQESNDEDDVLLRQTASILAHLSSITADAASRTNDNLINVPTSTDADISSHCLRLAIPCFGRASITRNGIHKEKRSDESYHGVHEASPSLSSSTRLGVRQEGSSGTILQGDLLTGSFMQMYTQDISVDQFAENDWTQHELNASSFEEPLVLSYDYGIGTGLFLPSTQESDQRPGMNEL
ncbi:unnamed protein product [Clonostachys byssicola]|uniref:Zn(2)-C6 fungal-type domain-containing protein n=1 Tax=Clonostachys byssicola TaxID=160290 RepID=A0A9N9UAM7_9HYPO|nr:unnamed protein product [Clonostachys byssicola]